MTIIRHSTLSDLYLLSQQFFEINQRKYHRQIIPEIGEMALEIIVGQRGVGKTTHLIQYLLNKVEGNIESHEILYVPCDHLLIEEYTLYSIAEAFDALGGKYLAFDEIHRYAHWAKELKSIADTFPKLRVIASGSSMITIRTFSHDLSRRGVIRSMPGYSFREYLAISHSIALPRQPLDELLKRHDEVGRMIVKRLESNALKVLLEFKKYLQNGYYPYSRQFQDIRAYYITLEQMLHFTIEIDLPNVYPNLTGASIRKIKQLLSFIARSLPFTANISKLRQLMELGDERTLKNYLNYLQEGGLIRLCQKASRKFRKVESVEKIYLENMNQLFALSPEGPNIGTVRELFFLSMLENARHQVTIPNQADFLVDDMWTFEIGGKNKTLRQIQGLEQSYLASDDCVYGAREKIPLWLFGFLY